jgi:hypothetical protein
LTSGDGITHLQISVRLIGKQTFFPQRLLGSICSSSKFTIFAYMPRHLVAMLRPRLLDDVAWVAPSSHLKTYTPSPNQGLNSVNKHHNQNSIILNMFLQNSAFIEDSRFYDVVRRNSRVQTTCSQSNPQSFSSRDEYPNSQKSNLNEVAKDEISALIPSSSPPPDSQVVNYGGLSDVARGKQPARNSTPSPKSKSSLPEVSENYFPINMF